jgi:hypothetical protein
MDISLFMSSNRPQWWKRMVDSLQENKCSWEIIAVGPQGLPLLPRNLWYYWCPFKPTQCYAAASYMAQGELIGWTADDAVYAPNALDIILDAYKKSTTQCIYTQSTIENSKDVTSEHCFFRNCKDTPVMCPMAFMNRKFFWECGGYDRQFTSGQAENDIIMTALSKGAVIENIPESRVYLNHEEVHGGFINKIKYRLGKNSFRTGYENDRRYLEECWVKEGYGTYDEKTLTHGTVSPVRLLPHQPFNYNNIFTVPAGPQGRWEKK